MFHNIILDKNLEGCLSLTELSQPGQYRVYLIYLNCHVMLVLNMNHIVTTVPAAPKNAPLFRSDQN